MLLVIFMDKDGPCYRNCGKADYNTCILSGHYRPMGIRWLWNSDQILSQIWRMRSIPPNTKTWHSVCGDYCIFNTDTRTAWQKGFCNESGVVQSCCQIRVNDNNTYTPYKICWYSVDNYLLTQEDGTGCQTKAVLVAVNENEEEMQLHQIHIWVLSMILASFELGIFSFLVLGRLLSTIYNLRSAVELCLFSPTSIPKWLLKTLSTSDKANLNVLVQFNKWHYDSSVRYIYAFAVVNKNAQLHSYT